MRKDDSYESLVKALLQELKEDPTYKFKLIFSIMSLIPFLSFFYVVAYIWPEGEALSLQGTVIMVLSILTSLCGFLWGYQTVKQLFNKVVVYAAKVKHSEKLKSELVAAVSHNFKTPISILKLSLSHMSDASMGDLNVKQQDHLQSCQNILAHMLRTITTLLDLYKVEAGMVGLKREMHDMAFLIENQLKEFDIMLSHKKIKLVKNITRDDLGAHIDKDKIVEVITNLLSNALKYTPDGGIIAVDAYPAGDFVRIEFKNSGGNIPFDKLSTIFEKFHRLESAQEGTGLGLAIAKDIVAIHDGCIWAENDSRDYVKFVVILPRKGPGSGKNTDRTDHRKKNPKK